jgi:ribosome maturation factor RimP
MAQRHGSGGRRTGAAGRSGGGRATDRDRRPDGARRPDDDRRSDRDRRSDGARRSTQVGDAAASRARLREIIEPVVREDGYDVEGLSLSRAGRRYLVRLIVDGDGGVNLDAVAALSHRVSAALDATEAGGEVLFAGEYELEVSSPGVDRPLTLPRHWRRNVGRLVQVKAGSGPQVTGRVVAADEDGIVLDVDGKHRELAYRDLGPGKIQLDFNRLARFSDADLESMLDPVAEHAEDDDTDNADHRALTGGDEMEEDEE